MGLRKGSYSFCLLLTGNSCRQLYTLVITDHLLPALSGRYFILFSGYSLLSSLFPISPSLSSSSPNSLLSFLSFSSLILLFQLFFSQAFQKFKGRAPSSQNLGLDLSIVAACRRGPVCADHLRQFLFLWREGFVPGAVCGLPIEIEINTFLWKNQGIFL